MLIVLKGVWRDDLGSIWVGDCLLDLEAECKCNLSLLRVRYISVIFLSLALFM
jgi:hypothetical protein